MGTASAAAKRGRQGKATAGRAAVEVTAAASGRAGAPFGEIRL